MHLSDHADWQLVDEIQHPGNHPGYGFFDWNSFFAHCFVKSLRFDCVF